MFGRFVSVRINHAVRSHGSVCLKKSTVCFRPQGSLLQGVLKKSSIVFPRAFCTKQWKPEEHTTVDENGDTVVDDDLTDPENLEWKDMDNVEKGKYLVSKYGMYTLVGGSFAYVISKTNMFITTTFMGLSFKTVGFWAFLAGYSSGIGTAAALYFSTKGIALRPEAVKKEAFRRVSSDAAVVGLMDVSLLNPLKSGIMRAYSLENGTIAIDRETRRIVWRKPRIKMLFQIYSNKHQAVVSVDAVKSGFSINIDMLTVDLLTQEMEKPLLIAGSEDNLSTAGHLRDFVHLKKRYV